MTLKAVASGVLNFGGREVRGIGGAKDSKLGRLIGSLPSRFAYLELGPEIQLGLG